MAYDIHLYLFFSISLTPSAPSPSLSFLTSLSPTPYLSYSLHPNSPSYLSLSYSPLLPLPSTPLSSLFPNSLYPLSLSPIPTPLSSVPPFPLPSPPPFLRSLKVYINLGSPSWHCSLPVLIPFLQQYYFCKGSSIAVAVSAQSGSFSCALDDNIPTLSLAWRHPYRWDTSFLDIVFNYLTIIV